MTENTVVVLTALNLEYEAVRRRLVDTQPSVHERGTRFEVGTLRGTNCRIALALTGKGNQPAAVLAERAIQQFEPTAVLFVGVAGALWDTPLGDVVVATRVCAYHGGTSEDDGLKARPHTWEADHGLSQLASHVARVDDWPEDGSTTERRPTVHFGAIAAGEIVHNSRISYEANWIRSHYNDALAIEMESAGVAQAGHLNSSPVAIIRGISDRADGTKNTDDDGQWQPRAAENAAAFATCLAKTLIEEREHSPMRRRNKDVVGDVVINTAHAPVGIQAKTVTNSNVSVVAASPKPEPVDLVAELEAVRQELARARSTGELDSITCAAAEDELDIAGKALEENTPEGQSRFVLALKRLRGLIEDAAEAATKVATLIAAVNGLS